MGVRTNAEQERDDVASDAQQGRLVGLTFLPRAVPDTPTVVSTLPTEAEVAVAGSLVGQRVAVHGAEASQQFRDWDSWQLPRDTRHSAGGSQTSGVPI